MVLDLNGTIATDGKIPSEVKEKINILSEKTKIYILTAILRGLPAEEIRDMTCELLKIRKKSTEGNKSLNP